MSKLAMVRQYRYAPAAGGLFSFIPKILGGAVNAVTGMNLIKTKTAAVQAVAPVQKLAAAPSSAAVKSLLGGGGGGTRRGKGISHRELKGYRKVARLLHKEGMVSKRAHGRKA